METPSSIKQRPPPRSQQFSTPQGPQRLPPMSQQFSTPQQQQQPPPGPQSMQYNVSQRPPPVSQQFPLGPQSQMMQAPVSQRPPPSQQFPSGPHSQMGGPVSQRPPPMSQQLPSGPPSQMMQAPVSQRPPPSQQFPSGAHSQMGGPMSQRAPPMSQQMQPAYAPGPISYQPAQPTTSGPVSTSSDFFDTLHQQAATPVKKPKQRQRSTEPEIYEDEDPSDAEPELYPDDDTAHAAESMAKQIRPYSAARSRDKKDGARSLSGIEAFLRRKTELDRATALGEETPREELDEEAQAELTEAGVSGGPEDTLRRACDMGDRKTVEQLLDEGADPNAQGIHGETALMYAARGDNSGIVQLLLRNGADANMCDHKGGTAMRQALRGRSMTALSILLKTGLDIDQRDANGRTLLMLAASEGDDEAVRLLLSMGASTEKRCMGFTALIIAVREGHPDVVRTLLNEGKTTIDKPGPKGVTALMYASSLGHHHIVRMLLEHGADPLMMDNLGYRATDFATGKWPDVGAVFQDFGYRGPCAWMVQKAFRAACMCCFQSKGADAFPEAGAEMSYKDRNDDLPALPSMGPRRDRDPMTTPKRTTFGVKQSKSSSKQKQRYETKEDKTPTKEVDSDDNEGTPLVDRYQNPVGEGTRASSRRSSDMSELGPSPRAPEPLPDGYEAKLPNDDQLPKLAMKLPDIGGIVSPEAKGTSKQIPDDVRAALDDDVDQYLPRMGAN